MLKKIKFQSKMIFFHILIVIFVALTLLGIFYQYVVGAMTDRANDDFETITDSVVSQLDNQLYIMDKTALQVAANPNIVNIFQKANKSDGGNYFIEEPVLSSEVVKLLNSYNFKKSGFLRICLYNDYGAFVCTATTVTTNGGVAEYFKSERYESIKEFFRVRDNFVYFVPPSGDLLNDTELSQTGYFSVVRQIKDYTLNSQQCGYVEVQERVEHLDQIFEGIGKDAFAVILDRDNKIIYGSPSLRDSSEEAVMEKLVELSTADGMEREAHRQLERHVSLKQMQNAPFTILFEKKNAVLVPLYQFHALMVGGMLLILITAIVTEVLIIHKLSKPLIELNHSVKNITLEHFEMDITNGENNDELTQLKDCFNTVMSRMKQSMEKQYAAETNELKAHLFALQSQMNPHFLYNIMAIISMESQADGNEKIQSMCSRLCGMLRYTSSMGDGFSVMREEADNAVNYMILMKERYEELFEYTVDMEERLQGVRIPKLIIEPLCENCFKHSFKNTEPVWKIRIGIYGENGKWFIEVHDNGTGFSAEYLEQFELMKKNITFHNVRENLEQISIGGLCIPNIYMRLMICYEDSFTCWLYNDEDGAVVVLGGNE